MKYFVTAVIAVFSLWGEALFAQSSAPVYRQFLFNPYAFNSGYVGINNALEANITYKQQWMGFQDAPAAAAFNVQFPSKKRVAIGFGFMSDKQVLVRSSAVMATFGYVVPFSENQFLRFGLSAGIGLNTLNLKAQELNTNDPAVMNAAHRSYYMDGNFGIVYAYDKLRLGFALTKLFQNNSFNVESFNEIKLSSLRNRLFSASYRFTVGMEENVSIEPYVLYRQQELREMNSWEAGALIFFNKSLWIGTAYNQNYGLSIISGFSIKDRFRLSYSYDMSVLNSEVNIPGSHEINLGIKLARKKSKFAAKPTMKPTMALANESNLRTANGSKPQGNKNPMRMVTSPPPDLTILEEPAVAVETRSEPMVTTPRNAKPEVASKPVEKAKISESFAATKGHYYVVVGVYSVMSHSLRYTKEMIEKGYPVNVILNPKNNYYYVYIFSSLDLEEAKKFRNDYRWKNLFKEAWIFNME